MGARTGRLPRRDVFHPGLSFRLYKRRDGSGRYLGRKQSRDNIEIFVFLLQNDVNKLFNALILKCFICKLY